MKPEPAAIVRSAADLRILAGEINAAHQAASQEEAKSLDAIRRGIDHRIIAGQLLLKAKSACGHGRWLAWLAENIKFTDKSARNYMKMAKAGSNWKSLSNLKDAISFFSIEAPDDPPPLCDAEGHIVPEELEEAFRNAGQFDAVKSAIREAEKTLEELAEQPGGEQLRRFLKPTGDEGKTRHKSEHLSALKRDLDGTKPHSVCPYCLGKAEPACKGCSGAGWVTKTCWKGIDDETKRGLE